MPNYKFSQDIIDKLHPVDISFMKSLYSMRCLDYDLAYNFFYRHVESTLNLLDNRLEFLFQEGFITEEKYFRGNMENSAYFLTAKGISILRQHYDLDSEYCCVVYRKNHDGERNYLGYRELSMNGPIIAHQLALNLFSLRLFDWADSQGIKYRYCDARFMTSCFSGLIPDAIFIPERGPCFFLEMDMGTERADQLNKRWKSYKNFLSGDTSDYKDRDIKVLFILENIISGKKRKANVVKTMADSELLASLGFLDFYVDMPIDLLELIPHFFIRSSRDIDFQETDFQPQVLHKLTFAKLDSYGLNYNTIPLSMLSQAKSTCDILKDNFLFSFYKSPNISDKTFDFRILKSDMSVHGKAITINGRPQDFLLDFWYDDRFSVMSKIFYHAELDWKFDRMVHGIQSHPAYLVVVPSEKYILDRLVSVEWFSRHENKSPVKTDDIFGNVFFTTYDRLRTRSFCEAVFQYHPVTKMRVHFTDDSLAKFVPD